MPTPPVHVLTHTPTTQPIPTIQMPAVEGNPTTVPTEEGSPQDHGEIDVCNSKKLNPKKNLSRVKKSINTDSKPKFKKGKPTKSLEKFSQVVKPTTKKQSLMLDYLTSASLSANEDQALDAISSPNVSED